MGGWKIRTVVFLSLTFSGVAVKKSVILELRAIVDYINLRAAAAGIYCNKVPSYTRVRVQDSTVDTFVVSMHENSTS